MHDDIKRYYESKRTCPVCHERNLIDTGITVLDIDPKKYIDRKNVTQCRTCGWRGYIDELLG